MSTMPDRRPPARQGADDLHTGSIPHDRNRGLSSRRDAPARRTDRRWFMSSPGWVSALH